MRIDYTLTLDDLLAFQSIDRMPDHLVITLGLGIAYVIPIRAFPTPAEAAAFESAARRLKDASATRPRA
jgi:hypothetical protein